MGKLALAAKITQIPSMYLSELPGPHHGWTGDPSGGQPSSCAP
jgi:3,4-dihydroxyphenylacetate 2,3-dioxygenase